MAQYSNLTEKPLKQAVKNSQDDSDQCEIAIKNYIQENVFEPLEYVKVKAIEVGTVMDKVFKTDIMVEISNKYYKNKYSKQSIGRLEWIHDTPQPKLINEIIIMRIDTKCPLEENYKTGNHTIPKSEIEELKKHHYSNFFFGFRLIEDLKLTNKYLIVNAYVMLDNVILNDKGSSYCVNMQEIIKKCAGKIWICSAD